MEKYLLAACAHINNEHKLAVIKEHLNELKKENIDVCLSINSSKYLEELSKYVKYIIYDENNDFLKPEDFVKNSELIYNNPANYGCMMFNIYSSLGFEFTSCLPFSLHSKPALILFRNACHLAYANGYKWVIYFEWDIPKPIKGYKDLFENMIQRLESDNKRAYIYKNNYTGIDYLWGCMSIVNTEIVNSTLLNQDWHINNYNWIKTWSLSFFEYCISAIISEMWGDNIIIDDISLHSESLWGIKDYREVQKSPYIIPNKRLMNNINHEWIHIVPKKEEEEYSLIVFAFCGQTSLIKNINVSYNQTIIFNIEEVTIHSNIHQIWGLPNYTETDNITLSYDVDTGMGYETYTESFLTKDIPKIYERLFRIK